MLDINSLWTIKILSEGNTKKGKTFQVEICTLTGASFTLEHLCYIEKSTTAT